MKADTLYISDLDGTLLSPDAELSDFTKNALSVLSGAGVNLSAATARTAATVVKMLDGSGINTPVVLMNGVCIYDLQKNEYVKTYSYDSDSKQTLISTVAEYGLSGFFYSVDNGRLSTFYENTDSPGAEKFIEERRLKYGKVFTKVDSFKETANRNLLYYSVSDYEKKLHAPAEKLRLCEGLRVEYYRDIYETDCFFLELSSALASKRTAIEFLREKYGFREIVGFGDNYNDLPLLEACDRFYAVENAVDAVKERATGIIGSNSEDSVAKWLLQNAL